MSSIADMLAELRGQPAPQPVEEPVPDDSAARIEALEKSVSALRAQKRTEDHAIGACSDDAPL